MGYKELENQGIIRKNINNLDNYSLLDDTFNRYHLILWKNQMITITKSFDDVYVDYIDGKLSGKGSRTWSLEIKEAIQLFNEKYKNVLEELKGENL
jgi:hypothetical protein